VVRQERVLLGQVLVLLVLLPLLLPQLDLALLSAAWLEGGLCLLCFLLLLLLLVCLLLLLWVFAGLLYQLQRFQMLLSFLHLSRVLTQQQQQQQQQQQHIRLLGV